MQAPALSAILLGYRAEEALTPIAESLYAELAAAGIDFELILVANYDADWPDTTAHVAADFAAGHLGVKVLDLVKAGGMGWDMRSGLEAAAGEFLVVIDGDGQNPTADVLRIYQAHLERGADVVKGRRSTRGDGLLRRCISIVYNSLFVVMFRAWNLWDINGKPKGLTRSAFESMELSSDDWFVDAEIVLEARRLGLDLASIHR